MEINFNEPLQPHFCVPIMYISKLHMYLYTFLCPSSSVHLFQTSTFAGLLFYDSSTSTVLQIGLCFKAAHSTSMTQICAANTSYNVLDERHLI